MAGVWKTWDTIKCKAQGNAGGMKGQGVEQTTYQKPKTSLLSIKFIVSVKKSSH